MVKNNMREYEIDLSLPIAQRWDEVLCNRTTVSQAQELVRKAIGEYSGKGQHIFILKSAIKMAMLVIAKFGNYGPYYQESYYLCRYISQDLLLANIAYELSSIGSKINLDWCTSVAFELPKLGMIHARNMDWPVEAIGKYTSLMHFKNAKAGNFTAVSVPGFIGVLSGTAKGRFSATINAAPLDDVKINPMGWPASWLLRHVFETCTTYKKAVKFLMKSMVIAPVYIQVVGCNPGEAVVIEVNPNGVNKKHTYEGIPLGVSNHNRWDKMHAHCNGCHKCGARDTCENRSTHRVDAIQRSAGLCKAKKVSGVIPMLQEEPVFSLLESFTTQSMVFNPVSGDMSVVSYGTNDREYWSPKLSYNGKSL